jgi:hypothetical protein
MQNARFWFRILFIEFRRIERGISRHGRRAVASPGGERFLTNLSPPRARFWVSAMLMLVRRFGPIPLLSKEGRARSARGGLFKVA